MRGAHRRRRRGVQLDPAATWEVLRDGAAASFMLDDRGERMVHGTDQVKSALDIFVKDMGLVTDAAHANDFPAPLASAAEQLYLAGHHAGLGRRDDSTVIEVLRGNRPASTHRKAEEAGR
ncbi:MAG TPA: NAD-binding protein [Actinophytocola sp.]|nr:NAD-binding protein [Actinophytocola sp.]